MTALRWWSSGTLGALLLALLLPVGCSGGGGGGGKGKGGNKKAESLDPVDTTQITDEDIRHFLSRTQLGAVDSEVAVVRSMGLTAYVQNMLAITPNPTLEAAAETATIANPQVPNGTELARYHEYLLLNNPNSFQEMMGMFWYDHFATSTQVLGQEERWWMLTHLNLLRNNSVGNLRGVIDSVSRDWVMLRFLDGLQSTANNPNENFARELWELYTLGRDQGYTQDDIEEAARSFTGFRTRLLPNGIQREVFFNPTLHDSTDKTIFGLLLPGRSGASGELEYLDVVNLTFDNPDPAVNRNVGQFISGKIWEWFVYTDPSDKLLEKLEQLWIDSNWEIAPVLETIFLSEAFFSDRAKEGLVKSPVEYMVGFVRQTDLQVPMNTLDNALAVTYQRPTWPPDVNGWPAGDIWLSSSGMVERANFIRDSIVNRTFQGDTAGNAKVEALLLPPGQRSDVEVVDRLAQVLNIRITDAERQEYVNYLNTDRDGTGTVITDPWDPTDATQMDKKGRGLIYIMAQHPTYHIR